MRLDSKTTQKTLKLAIVALLVLLSPNLLTTAVFAQTAEPGTMNGNSQAGGPNQPTNGPGTNPLAPGAQATQATDTTNFDDAKAQVNLITEAAENDEQQVIQNTNEELLQGTEFGAINETYAGMSKFWGDDIIGNLFQNIGQLIGRWFTEIIDGWIADTVHFLTSFLRTFVLNPNIAVNGIQNGPGAGGADDISPYVRDGADAMYGIAVDLLLLLFILCIWKYWAEAAWRGGAGLFGAVGRLIFTAGLLLAWPTIYAFEVQITNEMINAIWFNSADQVAQLDAAMTSAVKGGLVATTGLLANAFAPVVGAAAGGIVLGTVGEVVAFAGLVIYLFIGVILITELIYILVLKAIQTGLLTAQYMFAPIFIVFFATPDTENVTSGFVRSFVEVSLWTFVWVGLLKIMVIILYSDFNPWGKIVMAVGVLQIMIQVPTFLARASISPMSDFISAGMLTGGLMKGFSALGAMGQKRAMQAVDYFTNQQFGARGMPQSKKVSANPADAADPNLVNSLKNRKPEQTSEAKGLIDPVTGQPIIPPSARERGANKLATPGGVPDKMNKTGKEGLDPTKTGEKDKQIKTPGGEDAAKAAKTAPGTEAENGKPEGAEGTEAGKKAAGTPEGAHGTTAGSTIPASKAAMSKRQMARAMSNALGGAALGVTLGSVLAAKQAGNVGQTGNAGGTGGDAEREKAERENATNEGHVAQTLNTAAATTDDANKGNTAAKKEGAEAQKAKDVNALDQAKKDELKDRTSQLLAAAGLGNRQNAGGAPSGGKGQTGGQSGANEPAATNLQTNLKDGTGADKGAGVSTPPAAPKTGGPADAAKRLAENAAKGIGPLAQTKPAAANANANAEKALAVPLADAEHHVDGHGDETKPASGAPGSLDASQNVTAKKVDKPLDAEKPAVDANGKVIPSTNVQSGPPANPNNKAGQQQQPGAAAVTPGGTSPTDAKALGLAAAAGAGAAATIGGLKVPAGLTPKNPAAAAQQGKPLTTAEKLDQEQQTAETLQGDGSGAQTNQQNGQLKTTHTVTANGQTAAKLDQASLTNTAETKLNGDVKPPATPGAAAALTPGNNVADGKNLPQGTAAALGTVGGVKLPGGLPTAARALNPQQGKTATPGDTKLDGEQQTAETLAGDAAAQNAQQNGHLRTTHTVNAGAQDNKLTTGASLTSSTESKVNGEGKAGPAAPGQPTAPAAAAAAAGGSLQTPTPPANAALAGRPAGLAGMVAATKLGQQALKTGAAGHTAVEKTDGELSTNETLAGDGAALTAQQQGHLRNTHTVNAGNQDNKLTTATNMTASAESKVAGDSKAGQTNASTGATPPAPASNAPGGAAALVPPANPALTGRLAGLAGMVAATKLGQQALKTGAAGHTAVEKTDGELSTNETLAGDGAALTAQQQGHLRNTHTVNAAGNQDNKLTTATNMTASAESKVAGDSKAGQTNASTGATPPAPASNAPGGAAALVPPANPALTGRLAGLAGMVAATKLGQQALKTGAAGHTAVEKTDGELSTNETLAGDGAALTAQQQGHLRNTHTVNAGNQDNKLTTATNMTASAESKVAGDSKAGQTNASTGATPPAPASNAPGGAAALVPPANPALTGRLAGLAGMVAATKLGQQALKTGAAGHTAVEKTDGELSTNETLAGDGAALTAQQQGHLRNTHTVNAAGNQDNKLTTATNMTASAESKVAGDSKAGQTNASTGATPAAPASNAPGGAAALVPPANPALTGRLAGLAGMVAATKLGQQALKTGAAGHTAVEKTDGELSTNETLAGDGAALTAQQQGHVRTTNNLTASGTQPATLTQGALTSSTESKVNGELKAGQNPAAPGQPLAAAAAAQTPVPPANAALTGRLAGLAGAMAATKLGQQALKAMAPGSAEKLTSEGEATAETLLEQSGAGAQVDSKVRMTQNQSTVAGREGAAAAGATSTTLQEGRGTSTGGAPSLNASVPTPPIAAASAVRAGDGANRVPNFTANGRINPTAAGTVRGTQQSAETRGTQTGEVDVTAEPDTITALRSDGSQVQIRIRPGSPESRVMTSAQTGATAQTIQSGPMGAGVVAPAPGSAPGIAAAGAVAPPSKTSPTLQAAALHSGPARTMASNALNQVSQLQGRWPDPSMATQETVGNLESVLLSHGVPAATAATIARSGVLGVTAVPGGTASAQTAQTPNQTATVATQAQPAAATAQSFNAAPPRMGVTPTPGPGAGTPGYARVVGYQSVPGSAGGGGGGGGGGGNGIDYGPNSGGGQSRDNTGRVNTPPPPTGFNNFDQDNYRWVPLRNLANDIRTYQGPQQGMSREDDGHGTTTMGAKGISNVKYGKDTTDSQKAMHLMAAGYAQVFTTDPAAYDAARQAAIDEGGDAPRGVGQSIAANLLAYSGKSFKQTSLAKQQFTQALYQQAMSGAESYVNGDSGNAYTDYLRGRWGGMSPEQQAWGIHMMTDPTSPESGWSTTIQAASDTLVKAGMPITAENRAAASNQAVLRQPQWARGLAARGVAAYSVSLAEQQLGPNAHSLERDALVGRIAPALNNDYVDACRAIMEAAPSADIGAKMCADPVMVQSVAGTVAQARAEGRDIDAGIAYKNLMGPTMAMQRRSGSQSVDVLNGGGGSGGFVMPAAGGGMMPAMGGGVMNDTVIDQTFNNAGFVPGNGSVGNVGSTSAYVPGVGILGQTTMRPGGGFSSVHSQQNRATMDVHGTVLPSSTPVAAPGSLTALSMGGNMVQSDTTVDAFTHFNAGGSAGTSQNLGSQSFTGNVGAVPGRVTTNFIPGRTTGGQGGNFTQSIDVQGRTDNQSVGATGAVPNLGEQISAQRIDVVVNPNLGNAPNISGIAPGGTVTNRINPVFNFVPGQQRSGFAQNLVMENNAVSSTPDVSIGTMGSHSDISTESRVNVEARVNTPGQGAGAAMPSLNSLPNTQQIREQIRVDVVNAGLSNPSLGSHNYSLNQSVQADSRHASTEYSVSGLGNNNSSTYVQQGFAEVFVRQDASAGQGNSLQNEINSVGASAAGRMGASMHVAKQIVIDMMSAGFENEHIQDPRIANVAMQILQKDPSGAMLGTAAIAANVMNPEEYSVQTVETVQQMVDAGWSGRSISRSDVITARMVIDQGIGDSQGRPGYGYPEPSLIREIRADRRFVPEMNYASEQRGMTNRIPEEYADPLLRQQMKQSKNLNRRFSQYDSGED